MPGAHAIGIPSTSSRPPPPLHSSEGRSFPWAQHFTCGDVYIDWPIGKDLLYHSEPFTVEIAVPESFIKAEDGRNITKEGLSLVLTTREALRYDQYGNGTRNFLPLFRNLKFATGSDKGPHMRYLGFISSFPPSLDHNSNLKCDKPYHILVAYAPDSSIGSGIERDWRSHLLRVLDSDFMFRLYAESSMRAADAGIYTMKEQLVGPKCAEPIAQSAIFRACDAQTARPRWVGGPLACPGVSHWQYWNEVGVGYGLPWNTVCKAELPTTKPVEKSTDKGLLIGLPVGLGGGLLLILIVAALLYKNYVSRRGNIRL